MFSVFFIKQKTAYEMRISDWSSDVCSSDLEFPQTAVAGDRSRPGSHELEAVVLDRIVRRGDHDAAIDAILKRREIDFLGAAQAKVEHFRPPRVRPSDSALRSE